MADDDEKGGAAIQHQNEVTEIADLASGLQQPPVTVQQVQKVDAKVDAVLDELKKINEKVDRAALKRFLQTAGTVGLSKLLLKWLDNLIDGV